MALRTNILTSIQHLHRVQEHSSKNRMNAGNLAICFAYEYSNPHCAQSALTIDSPTLMVSNGVPNIADAGWQVRAVDTILQNTLQIFDDD